jgi:DNA-binding MarR family transcriptional regulator
LATPLDFGILLGLAFQSFSDELRADLARRGFTDLGKSYGLVFRALADEALHLNELAHYLGITAQGASKLIDEMAERGYVERVPDPKDGRAKRLELAPRGRSVLAHARRFHRSYERQLRERLGPRLAGDVRSALEGMLGAGSTRLRAL